VGTIEIAAMQSGNARFIKEPAPVLFACRTGVKAILNASRLALKSRGDSFSAMMNGDQASAVSNIVERVVSEMLPRVTKWVTS